MHTITEPQTACVRVIRTKNSVYALTTRAGSSTGRLACLEGTFEGESWLIDLRAEGALPVPGQPWLPYCKGSRFGYMRITEVRSVYNV